LDNRVLFEGKAVAAVIPVVGQYDPAGHVVAADIPVVGQYDPAGHVVAAVIPVVGQYDPAGHVYLFPSPGQYEPIVHVTHAFVVLSQYCPAAQYVVIVSLAEHVMVPSAFFVATGAFAGQTTALFTES
jgi:hypothetical protein